MLNFRQKVLVSYLLIFFTFVAFLYPVVFYLIGVIEEKNLANQGKELLGTLKGTQTKEAVIERLKEEELTTFFRVTLIDQKGNLLYDSDIHGQEVRDKEDFLNYPEFNVAKETGKGYDVRFSPHFKREMAYLALSFPVEGDLLLLRITIPYAQMHQLAFDFVSAFSILGLSMLLLFGILAWSIVHYLTRPVKQIIEAIRSYKEGGHLPEIHLDKEIRPNDEFGQLASTLNALSKTIDGQIEALTQQKNEKAALLESLAEGVIAVDKTLTLNYVNKMASQFLEITKEEGLGRSLVSFKYPILVELARKTLADHTMTTGTLPFKKKRVFDVIAVPRGSEGVLLVLQDKTGLHKVIELGRDFIANASHELKTPITIIQGFAETLCDHPDLSREVTRDIHGKILANSKRMEVLVKNLLTLASLDEGLPSSRVWECDLEEIIIRAKQTVLTVHPHADIQIETTGETPPLLKGDPDLLLQAFINLLDNASKYSKPPAHVKVVLNKVGEKVTVTIQDKGIGIPSEDLDRIFERFFAVDKSHSRSMGGSGLGLSIVEQIIERHGGKIKVESKPNVGSTFTLFFKNGS